jgi:hypothetical protein
MQKVALTHNSVKKNESDVLKEPRRRSKCDVAVITELCISAAYRISSSGSSL